MERYVLFELGNALEQRFGSVLPAAFHCIPKVGQQSETSSGQTITLASVGLDVLQIT